MASTKSDRRLMIFIAIAISVACLVAIAALVLAAIMISMVRSGNTPTASKLGTNVQGKRPKYLSVSRHAKLKCLLLKDVPKFKCLRVLSLIDLLNVTVKRVIAGILKSNQIGLITVFDAILTSRQAGLK